jgi:hypothetical protein
MAAHLASLLTQQWLLLKSCGGSNHEQQQPHAVLAGPGHAMATISSHEALVWHPMQDTR